VVAGTGQTLWPRDRTPMTAPRGLTRIAYHGHGPEEYSGSTRWDQVDWSWMGS
jgi:hypothetical protein